METLDTILQGLESTEPLDPVRETLQLLEIYHSERIPWAQQAKTDEDFRYSNQWTAEEKRILESKGHPPVTINLIHSSVELAKALLTSHSPQFMFTAEEDSDTGVAKIFSDITSYIWDRSLGNVELKKVIDDMYVRGAGYMFVYYEPNVDLQGGEIYIKHISPYDVYPDPNSKDIFLRDASNIMICRVYTLEQLLTMYPDIITRLNELREAPNTRRPVSQQVQGDFSTLDIHTYNTKYYEVIDRYTKVKEVIVIVNDKENGIEKEYTSEEFKTFLEQEVILISSVDGKYKVLTRLDDIQMYKQILQEYGGVVHYQINPIDPQGEPIIASGTEDPNNPNVIPGSTINISVTRVGDVIDKEYSPFMYGIRMRNRIKRRLIVGEVLYYEEVMPIEDYPIIPFFNYHNGNPYPMSDVRFIRPIQELVNKIRSLIVAHAANSTSMKILVPRGSINKEEFLREWEKAGPSVLEVDFELGQPVIASPPPLPNELYKAEADLRHDIEYILGVFSISQGDVQVAPNTYGGILAIDDYAQRRIKSKLSDIEAALTFLGRVVMQFIQKYYTEPRVLRIITPNNQQREVSINQPIYNPAGLIVGRINDVSIGKYDVRVVSGSTLPSNRWALMDYYMKLFQVGLIDREAVLRKSEIAEVDDILRRMSEIETLKQQLAQATMTIKELQSKLKIMDNQLTNAERRVKVAKFDRDVHKLKTEMQATAEIATQTLANNQKKE